MPLFESDEKTKRYLKRVGELTASLQIDFREQLKIGPIRVKYRDPRFTEIVNLTSQRMKNKILSKYNKSGNRINEHTAVELVGDVFLEFFSKRIMTIKDPTRTVGYLYRMLASKAIDELQRPKEIQIKEEVDHTENDSYGDEDDEIYNKKEAEEGTLGLKIEPVNIKETKNKWSSFFGNEGSNRSDIVDDCLTEAIDNYAIGNEENVELLRQNTGIYLGKYEEPRPLDLIAEEEGIEYANMRKKISNIRKKLLTYFTTECLELIQETYIGK